MANDGRYTSWRQYLQHLERQEVLKRYADHGLTPPPEEKKDEKKNDR